jgi:hypothetical protein
MLGLKSISVPYTSKDIALKLFRGLRGGEGVGMGSSTAILFDGELGVVFGETVECNVKAYIESGPI